MPTKSKTTKLKYIETRHIASNISYRPRIQFNHQSIIRDNSTHTMSVYIGTIHSLEKAKQTSALLAKLVPIFNAVLRNRPHQSLDWHQVKNATKQVVKKAQAKASRTINPSRYTKLFEQQLKQQARLTSPTARAAAGNFRVAPAMLRRQQEKARAAAKFTFWKAMPIDVKQYALPEVSNSEISDFMSPLLAIINNTETADQDACWDAALMSVATAAPKP